MAVPDVYLRAAGQSLYRLMPPNVKERVKKIEIGVVRNKYKPLRPAIMNTIPVKELPSFVLTPNTIVYVIVTDR